MRSAVAFAFVSLVASSQTLPRPAAPFEFTLADGQTKSRLADHKNKIVLLYLFSPN